MKKRLLALGAFLVASGAGALGACGGTTATSPPAPTDGGALDATTSPDDCTPGTICVCPNGAPTGVQACAANGAYGACNGCAGLADGGPLPLDGASDGAPGDASTPRDSGADASSVPASLVFAHAAPGVPPIRLCVASTQAGVASVAAIPALPHFPSGAPAVPAIGPYPATAAGTPGYYPGEIVAVVPEVTDFRAIDLTRVRRRRLGHRGRS